MYDLRSREPYIVKDHGFGSPIKQVKFNTEQDNVISTDSKQLKIWNENSVSKGPHSQK